MSLALLAVLAAGILLGGLRRRDRTWKRGETQPGAFNILLISLDTVRPDPLEACGGTRVPTPGLDRIRGGGFVFSQMVTPVPVTLPAHGSLFTAQNPNRHGVRENTEYALPAGTPTLARQFQDAGWITAAFVASFILDSRFGLAQGFTDYVDRLNGPEPGLGPGTVELPGLIVAQRAQRWISDYAARRNVPGAPQSPFFLFLHFFDAHAPYQPPPPYDVEYRDRPYDGELAYNDYCVGQVLDGLERSGEARRTLVWVVSDHGESLGEHGEATHSLFIYDATLRVVSLLCPPPSSGRFATGRPRRILEGQASLVDVAPTLLELAGIHPGLPDPDGRSLLPLLTGRRLAEPPLYCETLSPKVSYHWAPLFGVRTGEWKYIRAPVPELYNLKSDPSEGNNLASARPDEVARLARILDGLLALGSAPGGEERPGGSGNAGTAGRVPTQEERERLRSLGYLAGSTAGGGNGAGSEKVSDRDLPDPKRMVRFFNEQYQQAKNLLYQGRYEQAVSAFREALRVDPLNNSIHLFLAGALRQAGRPVEAGRSYREALRIEPHSPRAYFGWGEALLASGRADSAAWAYRRSIELLPHSPEAWVRLGAAEWSRGNLPAAAQAYENGLEYGADPGTTHGLLARLYAESPGFADQAQEHLRDYARHLGVPTSEAAKRLPEAPK